MSYGSIDYVDHTQVTQKLIALIPDVQITINYNVGEGGVFYDDHITQDGEIKRILTGIAVSISGNIDNQYRVVEEVGMCDKPFEVEGNKPPANNGERAKECMSDAIKRCAMRLGVGIELYGKDSNAWLYDYLGGHMGLSEDLDPKEDPKEDPKYKYTQDKNNPPNEKDLMTDDLKEQIEKTNAESLVKEIAVSKDLNKEGTA
jgi:hypothetical protein